MFAVVLEGVLKMLYVNRASHFAGQIPRKVGHAGDVNDF